MRQALSAKARKEPNCIQELRQELIERLQVGSTGYNELGLHVDANNRGALWNERPFDFANQDDDLVPSSFEMIRNVLRTSSTDTKTANLLSQIRQLIGVTCPPGLTSRVTRTCIDALLLRVLGSTQTRDNVMPNWCGVEQLLSVLNRMSFVIANEPAQVWAHLPRHLQRDAHPRPLFAIIRVVRDMRRVCEPSTLLAVMWVSKCQDPRNTCSLTHWTISCHFYHDPGRPKP
jgi:hypothetical protein